MTIHEQVFNIIIMTISGIFFGAFIDLLRRILEGMSPSSLFYKMSKGIEVIVWALLGVCTFIILFYIKGGEWRLVDPLAQICGIYLYESIFQPIFRFVGKIIFLLFLKPILVVIQIIKWILKGILRVLNIIFLIIMYPFSWIYRKVLGNYFQKTLIKVQKSIFKN